MPEIGADPEQLDELAHQIRRTASELGSCTRRLDGSVRSADWKGRDADRFRSGWSAHRGALGAACDSLNGLAATLSSNAQQQRSTSQAEPTAAAPGVTPAALPERTEVWGIELGGGAGLIAGLGGSLRIDDMPGPTSRVTVQQHGSVGAAAGMGGSIETKGGSSSGPGAALGADVSGVATMSSTWIVPDDDAVGFGQDRATEAAMDLIPGMQTTRSVVQGLLGNGPPAPAEQTFVAGVVFSGVLKASAGPFKGKGEMGGSAQIGIRQRGDETSLVAITAGAGAGQLSGILFGSSAPAAIDLTTRTDIEVFPAHDGVRKIVITTTTISGDDAMATSTTILVDDDKAGDSLDEAWDHLSRGDLVGAADSLSDLPDAVIGTGTSVTGGGVTTTAKGASATAADGPRASGSYEGTHTIIDWD